jgi:hypothetical protein
MEGSAHTGRSCVVCQANLIKITKRFMINIPKPIELTRMGPESHNFTHAAFAFDVVQCPTCGITYDFNQASEPELGMHSNSSLEKNMNDMVAQIRAGGVESAAQGQEQAPKTRVRFRGRTEVDG